MSISVGPFINSVISSIINYVSSDNVVNRVGKIKLVHPYVDDKAKLDLDFSRFSKLKIDDKNVFRLSNGDFVAYLKCDNEYYICLSVDSFDSKEIEQIDILMERNLAFQTPLEPCFFMHIVHCLNSYYRIRNDLSAYGVIDTLGLTSRELEEDYVGHDISDIMDLFMPLRIYKVDAESILLMADRWYFICLLALECRSLQANAVDSDLITLAKKAFEQGKCNLENIYLSLTSSHHKYMFIEICRCLEALYYLPWMIALKNNSGVKHDAFSLAKLVSKSLGWKEKERESINNLFILLPDDIFTSVNIKSLSFIPSEMKEMNDINDNVKSKYSDIIYNVRNQSVHQQDYEEIKQYRITSDDWMILTKFVFMCVNQLYSAYRQDIYVYECEFVDV